MTALTESTASRHWLSPSLALAAGDQQPGVRLHVAPEAKAQARYGFRIGSLALLVPLGVGSEVAPLINPAVIPNGPAWLSGVINLRGALVPVVDLRGPLGLDPARAGDGRGDASARPMVLIFGKGEEAAGFLIDGYPRAVAELRPGAQMPPLPEPLAGCVSAAWASDADIWIDFDHRALLTALGCHA